MAEEYYQDAQHRTQKRETKTAAEADRGSAEYDPRTAGRTADRRGRPKRGEYGEGLAGDAAFTKAERAWRRTIQEDALQK
jgi:hypothetical protein